MGKQYKNLTKSDIDFIREQKLFYLASTSIKELNISPKGYDSIRVLDQNTVILLNHPGSGNRTHRDTMNNGKFTLLFNAFEGKAKILRLFCTAEIVQETSSLYKECLLSFNEKKEFVRNFFKFSIYAVESSCGDSVPYMEYKQERDDVKKWMRKMDENNKLEAYTEKHFLPPDLDKLK